MFYPLIDCSINQNLFSNTKSYIYIYIYIISYHISYHIYHISYHISYISYIISPLIGKLPRNLKYPSKLFCCSIKSLYTNISHEFGITALDLPVTQHLHKIDKRFTKEFILESTYFILVSNNFYFDEILYRQLIGTAMGTDFAPPYAGIAVR